MATIAVVSNVQVLLDGHGVSPDVLVLSVQTLLREVDVVEVVRAPAVVRPRLKFRFGDSVAPADSLRRNVPLVVASGRVAFAAGSLRRLRNNSEIPGRCLTRVLFPGPGGDALLACWSAQWLASYGGDFRQLLEADLDFDREHLSATSPMARSWVLAEAIGVALADDAGTNVDLWRQRTGLGLDAAQLWASRVRAPAGVARRRMSRWQHRRQRAALSRTGR